MATNAEPGVAQSVENITEVIEKLPRLVRAVDETSNEIEKAVDHAISQVTEIKKAGVKLESRAKSAYQDVLDAVRMAKAYLEKVEDFFYYGNQAERKTQEMTDATHTKDYQPLIDMLDQLQRTLVQVGERYEVFIEACSKASTSTVNAAEECRRKKIEAEDKKTKTQIAGGTIAGVSFAAGIGLAILTFGAATPLSIGLCAGGATAATATGTAATVTACVMVSGYEKAQKAFKDLSDTFNSLDRKIRDIENEVRDINAGLETIVSIINDVEINARVYEREREEERQREEERERLAMARTPIGIRFLKRLFGRKRQSEATEPPVTSPDDEALATSAELLFEKLKEKHPDVETAKDKVEQKKQQLQGATENL